MSYLKDTDRLEQVFRFQAQNTFSNMTFRKEERLCAEDLLKMQGQSRKEGDR
jgi:hypothetical protein